MHRVHLTILDFPNNFWHPFYFREAIASMGLVRGIQRECLNGDDSTAIRLWLDPPPPPHSPESDDSNDPLPPQDQDQFRPGYIPPWRRRVLRINFPMKDPSGRGAPAACGWGLRFWHISTGATPGSSAEVDAKATVRGVSQLAMSVKKQHHMTLRGYANNLFHSHTTPRLHSVYTSPFSNKGNLRHMVANYPSPNSQRKDKFQEDCLPIPHNPPPHITPNQNYLWKPSTLLMGPSILQIKTKLLINPHALSLLGHIHTFFSSSKQNYSSLLSIALSLLFGLLSILSLLLLLLMASITEEDEALIQRFIDLHTNDSSSPVLQMPSGATSSTDWSRCLLSRVISSRVAIESQFQQAMMKAWDADPNTSFKSVAKNTFLLEFTDLLDLQTALNGGPWTFKGDLVAFKMVKLHEELKPSEIKEASL